jgi:hypothetical protein
MSIRIWTEISEVLESDELESFEIFDRIMYDPFVSNGVEYEGLLHLFLTECALSDSLNPQDFDSMFNFLMEEFQGDVQWEHIQQHIQYVINEVANIVKPGSPFIDLLFYLYKIGLWDYGPWGVAGLSICNKDLLRFIIEQVDWSRPHVLELDTKCSVSNEPEDYFNARYFVENKFCDDEIVAELLECLKAVNCAELARKTCTTINQMNRFNDQLCARALSLIEA